MNTFDIVVQFAETRLQHILPSMLGVPVTILILCGIVVGYLNLKITSIVSGKNFSKDTSISRNVQFPIIFDIHTLLCKAARQLAMCTKIVKPFCLKITF